MTDAPPPPPPPPGAGVPPPPPPGLTAPPGYVGYSGHAQPAASLRRIRGLTTAIIVLVAIAGVGAIASALLVATVRGDAQDFLDGTTSSSDFESAYAPVAFAQLALGAATLAAGVVTVIWMFRIASNTRAYQRPTFWHPLWAIFGWLVPPFVLYIIPFLMLRELWKHAGPESGTPVRENVALWLWFVLFGIVPAILVVVQVGSLGAGLQGGSTEDLAEQLSTDSAASIASGVVSAVAAVVWIVFVRQLRDRHVALTNER